MGVGGLATAHQTGLRRDKLAVEFVAQSARSGRDSVVLEIWEVCGRPVRVCGCTGCVRSHLGWRRDLRGRGFAWTIRQRLQFGDFLTKCIFDEQRIPGVEGVLGC